MSEKKIIAACGFRFEPEWLLEEWKENLSWVDGFAVVDDRGRDASDLWGDETWLYAEQRRLAREQDADWILVSAPDERWDETAETQIRKAMEMYNRKKLSFPVLSLRKPDRYRSDRGFWQHREFRVYPLLDDQEFDTKPFHNHIVPINDRWMTPLMMNTNIYDISTIEPENQVTRVELYKARDPEAEFTVLDSYDELLKEKGVLTTKIKSDHRYYPPYRKFIRKNPLRDDS